MKKYFLILICFCTLILSFSPGDAAGAITYFPNMQQLIDLKVTAQLDQIDGFIPVARFKQPGYAYIVDHVDDKTFGYKGYTFPKNPNFPVQVGDQLIVDPRYGTGYNSDGSYMVSLTLTSVTRGQTQNFSSLPVSGELNLYNESTIYEFYGKEECLPVLPKRQCYNNLKVEILGLGTFHTFNTEKKRYDGQIMEYIGYYHFNEKQVGVFLFPNPTDERVLVFKDELGNLIHVSTKEWPNKYASQRD